MSNLFSRSIGNRLVRCKLDLYVCILYTRTINCYFINVKTEICAMHIRKRTNHNNTSTSLI